MRFVDKCRVLERLRSAVEDFREAEELLRLAETDARVLGISEADIASAKEAAL